MKNASTIPYDNYAACLSFIKPPSRYGDVMARKRPSLFTPRGDDPQIESLSQPATKGTPPFSPWWEYCTQVQDPLAHSNCLFPTPPTIRTSHIQHSCGWMGFLFPLTLPPISTEPCLLSPATQLHRSLRPNETSHTSTRDM